MRTIAGFCLLAIEQPALRRQDLYIGFYMEREKLLNQCAISPHQNEMGSRMLRHTEVIESGGLTRSSDEISVMEMERRG